MTLYSIASYASGDEFLALVANKRGKIGKGGVINVDAAAKLVLKVSSDFVWIDLQCCSEGLERGQNRLLLAAAGCFQQHAGTGQFSRLSFELGISTVGLVFLVRECN